MRFFLVGRDRVSGAVRIVSEQPLASRQEAIDSLASSVAGVDDLTASDYFVVDLESVTPVVLYREPDASPAAEEIEPIADAWETPGGEASVLLEPVDDVPGNAAAHFSEGDLASALRRAATSMEGEGVVPAATVEEVLAAESTGAIDEAATNDVLAAELDALASIAAVTMTTGANEDEAVVAAPDEEFVVEPVATEAAPWPWESEPADESASPSVEDAASDAGEASEQDDVSPAALASIIDEESPPGLSDVLAPSLLPLTPDEPSKDAGVEPVDDLLSMTPDEAEAESEPMIYEPQAIDMDSYTCEDCVYVSTCPKAGQDSPASCGSFQWKSV